MRLMSLLDTIKKRWTYLLESFVCLTSLPLCLATNCWRTRQTIRSGKKERRSVRRDKKEQEPNKTTQLVWVWEKRMVAERDKRQWLNQSSLLWGMPKSEERPPCACWHASNCLDRLEKCWQWDCGERRINSKESKANLSRKRWSLPT